MSKSFLTVAPLVPGFPQPLNFDLIEFTSTCFRIQITQHDKALLDIKENMIHLVRLGQCNFKASFTWVDSLISLRYLFQSWKFIFVWFLQEKLLLIIAIGCKSLTLLKLFFTSLVHKTRKHKAVAKFDQSWPSTSLWDISLFSGCLNNLVGQLTNPDQHWTRIRLKTSMVHT